jgi:transposase
MQVIEQSKIQLADLLINNLNNALFIGIDPHKFKHHVMVTNRNQDVLKELEIANNHSDINLLIQEILKIKVRYSFNNIIIGIEGYHGNGEFITNKLQEHFSLIYEVPVSRTSSYRKTNVYREKTDRIDSLGVINSLTQHLTELSVITKNSNASLPLILNDLVMTRQRFVRQRISVKNSIHHLMQHIDPEYVLKIKTFNTKKSWKLTNTLCKQILKSNLPLEINNRAKLTIRNIKYLIQVEENISDLEKEIKDILESSKYMYLIDSYKGIGYVTLAEILSLIYDIDRFANPEKFCKYCGIAPISFSSGNSKKFHSNKFGVRELRTIFHTIAVVRVRRCPEDKEYYERHIARGKTKKQALILLMRKNALTVYALLRKKQAYVTPVLGSN